MKKLEKNKLSTEEELVASVIQDFKQRQYDRKKIETSWQININFLVGNQYCTVNSRNELIDYDKQYFWQEREVYNHLASIHELRLSKLDRVRPSLTIIPFSDEEDDVVSAKISKKILHSAIVEHDIKKKISEATMWSEICGSSFYKVSWNAQSGRVVAVDEEDKSIYEGDVEISVVSPFEIFPDSNCHTKIEDCKSIIHAKAYHADEIKTIWDIDVDGGNLDVFTLDSINNIGGLGYNGLNVKAGTTVKKNHVLVIEKYESPTKEYPNGRLLIVAGNKLVFDGELPYINQWKNARGFPFIQQSSLLSPGSFWGTSVIERCIPIQRAYNAVKNRKHEFLNKLSMGVLTVEDGSVDTDNLEEEGMSPGKVLIYRQGSTPPKQMSSGQLPSDFGLEEDRLLNEFVVISGVSDLVRNSAISSSTMSGTALQLLLEQDESRLVSSAEQIRQAVKDIGKHILRLYKQFAVLPHTSKIVGDANTIEIFYWKNTDINSDDVVFEADSELNETLAQKRSMIFEVLNAGLLHDENGKLSNSIRGKVLEQLGFGVWEYSQDLHSLQVRRANRENFEVMSTGKISNPKEIDDHKTHINQHITYMLGEEYSRIIKKKGHLEKEILNHINKHKEMLSLQNDM